MSVVATETVSVPPLKLSRLEPVAIGSDSLVTFTPALWARLVRDRIDYVKPVAAAMVDAITEHLATKAATAKN